MGSNVTKTMNDNIEIFEKHEVKENIKTEYQKPVLKEYGKVAKMTKGGSGPNDDGGDLAFEL